MNFKLLTMLLLTVSVCVGQDSTKTTKWETINGRKVYGMQREWLFENVYQQPSGTIKEWSFYKDGKPFMSCFLPNDSLWFSQELKSYLAIGIKLWDIYAKECYADSTEIGIVRMIGSPDSLGRYKFKKEYWHVTKPTLEGFVEFLRRKIK